MAQEMEMNNSISFYSCHAYRLTVEINQTVNHSGEGYKLRGRELAKYVQKKALYLISSTIKMSIIFFK